MSKDIIRDGEREERRKSKEKMFVDVYRTLQGGEVLTTKQIAKKLGFDQTSDKYQLLQTILSENTLKVEDWTPEELKKSPKFEKKVTDGPFGLALRKNPVKGESNYLHYLVGESNSLVESGILSGETREVWGPRQAQEYCEQARAPVNIRGVLCPEDKSVLR